ncbi:MAG: phosphoglycerate kinase [bacterium]|nr:phosphoglycerate kinase [bacterium]
MQSLKKLDLKGKRVLTRVDFNVPLDGTKVADDSRIKAVMPTMNYITEHNGKLVLMSHLGRPKGKVVESMSLKPVAEYLSEMIGKKVKFIPSCISEDAEKATKEMKNGDIILLENTRFFPEEEKNDMEFAKKLAKLGDIYIDDAFGSAHRAHASVEAITHLFDVKAPGFLMENEVNYLSKLIENPEKPFVAILGGAKVSTKMDIIVNLLPKVDNILIGGGMVFTFFKALGYKIGTSIVEEDKIPVVKELLEKGKGKIVLPVDIIAADKFENNAQRRITTANFIPEGFMGLDIGPKTTENFNTILMQAKTIFWNGPTGVFELDNFSSSTRAIAKQLAMQTHHGVTAIIGGGDTVAAVNKFGLADSMTHISTGGGASLEFLSGLKLPGVEALR